MTTKSKGSINDILSRRKTKGILSCKRCGAILEKPHFQLQPTLKKTIDVCSACFRWSADKTTKEIKEDCKSK